MEDHWYGCASRRSVPFCTLDSSLTCCDASASKLWHGSLGHPSSSLVKLVHELASNVSFSSDSLCTVCPSAKQHGLPFLISHLIHRGIWGLSVINLMDNHRFFLTIVDDFTKCTFVYLMQSKAEV